jgi:hypothetical protein
MFTYVERVILYGQFKFKLKLFKSISTVYK